MQTTKSNRIPFYPPTLAALLLAFLVALPAGAAAQDQELEVKTEKTRHVFVTEDGQKIVREGEPAQDEDHRFVVVRTDGNPSSVDEPVVSDEFEVKVLVADDLMADDEDGEPRVFRWRTEDGELTEFEPGAFPNAFFVSASPRGFLGVQLVELTPELREHYGVSADVGVLVGKVVAGSPAEEAGLRVGDVLTGLDGEAVASAVDVRRHVGALEDGEVVALELYRDGQRLERTARVVERERPQVDVRRFLERHELEGGDGQGAWSYEIDTGEMGQALEELRVRITDPEFKERLMHFSNREEQLEKRIEELEARIEELARALEEK